MSRWFRYYTESLDDPKVQKLDGDTFKIWVNILCVAAKNDGVLPPTEDLSFALRLDNNACETVLERLLNAGLIDRRNGGPNGTHNAPHGWSKRQYKSDTSSERVKRYRSQKKAVTVTPPETDTETENTLSKDSDASASDPDKVFWESATSYLGGSRRGMIGKWVRDYGRQETAKAIAAAQVERAVDPIAYINRILRGGKSGDAELPIC